MSEKAKSGFPNGVQGEIGKHLSKLPLYFKQLSLQIQALGKAVNVLGQLALEVGGVIFVNDIHLSHSIDHRDHPWEHLFSLPLISSCTQTLYIGTHGSSFVPVTQTTSS